MDLFFIESALKLKSLVIYMWSIPYVILFLFRFMFSSEKGRLVIDEVNLVF